MRDLLPINNNLVMLSDEKRNVQYALVSPTYLVETNCMSIWKIF